VQSLFASLSGYLYFWVSSSSSSPKRVFPGVAITARLLLVSLTQTLASPFGYRALAHIDYITYILAKSCKLLPVMFLHVTLFRRKYPLYKYLVVFAVSAGVAVFTLYPSTPKKSKTPSSTDVEKNVVWGLSLLGMNLLFDGLTNTIQDDIFMRAPKGTVSGPQMMAALNTISSVLTALYLLLNPWSTELAGAMAFVAEHPKVGLDILGFAFCGAVGQVFICTNHSFQNDVCKNLANGRISPHVGEIRIAGTGNGQCHKEDAVDGIFGGSIRPQSVDDADARCRLGVQRHQRGSGGEAPQREFQEATEDECEWTWAYQVGGIGYTQSRCWLPAVAFRDGVMQNVEI